jgi:hypothetical protein
MSNGWDNVNLIKDVQLVSGVGLNNSATIFSNGRHQILADIYCAFTLKTDADGVPYEAPTDDEIMQGLSFCYYTDGTPENVIIMSKDSNGAPLLTEYCRFYSSEDQFVDSAGSLTSTIKYQRHLQIPLIVAENNTSFGEIVISPRLVGYSSSGTAYIFDGSSGNTTGNQNAYFKFNVLKKKTYSINTDLIAEVQSLFKCGNPPANSVERNSDDSLYADHYIDLWQVIPTDNTFTIHKIVSDTIGSSGVIYTSWTEHSCFTVTFLNKEYPLSSTPTPYGDPALYHDPTTRWYQFEQYGTVKPGRITFSCISYNMSDGGQWTPYAPTLEIDAIDNFGNDIKLSVKGGYMQCDPWRCILHLVSAA